MAKKKINPASREPRIENRKASHQYSIDERLEVGIVLRGSEVKSVRLGQVSLAEGFARVEPATMELWLHGVNIALYPHAGGANGHEAAASRKLLAHKREIKRLFGLTSAKGTSLIPLCMYFKGGRVKMEIGVGTGKKQHDKREDLKKKDASREIRRAMAKKVL